MLDGSGRGSLTPSAWWLRRPTEGARQLAIPAERAHRSSISYPLVDRARPLNLHVVLPHVERHVQHEHSCRFRCWPYRAPFVGRGHVQCGGADRERGAACEFALRCGRDCNRWSVWVRPVFGDWQDQAAMAHDTGVACLTPPAWQVA